MFKEIPRWLYMLLATLAILTAAAEMTLVGKVPWLQHDSTGEAYLQFAMLVLTMAGFGSMMKRKPLGDAEPLPLPPPPKAGEQ